MQDERCRNCEELSVALYQIKQLQCLLGEKEERLEKLSPQLPDDMRRLSRKVWEMALEAHADGRKGEPGPIGIIARALSEAEERGEGNSKQNDLLRSTPIDTSTNCLSRLSRPRRTSRNARFHRIRFR